MGSVTFQLGATADIVTGEEMKAGLDGLYSRMRRDGTKDRAIRRIEPQSGVMPSSGPLLLSFGGPPTGALWAPQWVTVTGSDDRTVVAAGTWALYFGGLATLNPMLGNLLVPANGSTIPGFQPVGGKDTVYGHEGDELFVLVYGAAAGTNIAAIARIREVHPSNVEELNVL